MMSTSNPVVGAAISPRRRVNGRAAASHAAMAETPRRTDHPFGCWWTVGKPTKTNVHNGGSACVLPDSARHSASHRRSATPRGQPSIQRRLDWSARGTWVAGRGSSRSSIERRHGHIMLELARDMRQMSAFCRYVVDRPNPT